jgi:hypothetical protein
MVGSAGVSPAKEKEAFGARGEIDATVDLEAEIQTAFAPPRIDLLELRQHVAAERLAAEAGLHRHHQHEIDGGEQVFDGGRRRAGIQHDAVLAAELADAGERAGVIIRRLDVDADEIGAGLGKRFHVAMRLGQHQVRVEKELRAGAAQRGERLGAEGQIRHEVPVHDVAMQPRQFEVLHDSRARGEVGVIAGEQGRVEERSVQRRNHGRYGHVDSSLRSE